MSNYPPGVTDDDDHFNLPSGRSGGSRDVTPPKTTMVYCPPCMKHRAAPATKDYWKPRVELCPEHQEKADDDEFGGIPCCRCGKPTTWDPTYQDLCYRCCRVSGE